MGEEINKKAYLVTFSVIVRVTKEKAAPKESVIIKALEKILNSVEDYLNMEACEDVKEDTECPYGTFDDDFI